MSICEQICQALEGYITVNSILGVGSEFIFTMRVFLPNQTELVPIPEANKISLKTIEEEEIEENEV